MRLEVAEGHANLFALLNKKMALPERSEKVEPVIVSPTGMQDGRRESCTESSRNIDR